MEAQFNSLTQHEIKKGFFNYVLNRKRCDKSQLGYLFTMMVVIDKIDPRRYVYIDQWKRDEILSAMFHLVERNDNCLFKLKFSEYMKRQIVECINK